MPHSLPPGVLSISPASAANGNSQNSIGEDPVASGPLPRWPQALVALLLAGLIVAAMAIAALLAAAHARDRYWINIASGSWVALAWQADHGTLYPPLRDVDGNFGGTRYMPLHVLMHWSAARATGEFLFSGRIIGFGCAIGWFAGIIALARQRGCPWLVAAALGASVLASPTGVQALCTIRSDGLALALQLWALWIVGLDDRSPRTRTAAMAAVLCALGFLAKLTAVWAAVGIGLWLLLRSRRCLLVFVVTGLVVAGVAIAAVNLTSDGRFLDTILHSSATGWRGWGSVVVWSQRRVLQFVSEWSPTTWVLAAPAALAIVLAAAKRDLNAVHFALLACCMAMMIMFADAGVGENHILELAAITAVGAGDLWRRARNLDAAQTSTRPAWTIAQMLLAVAVGMSSLAVIVQRLWQDIDQARVAMQRGEPSADDDPHALDATLAGKRFLSDDPTLAILLNQKPVLNDAFMFRGFEASRPEWVDELVGRIAAREFEVIALTREADPDSWWYRELFLGPRVTQAIAGNYRLEQTHSGYFVYLPR